MSLSWAMLSCGSQLKASRATNHSQEGENWDNSPFERSFCWLLVLLIIDEAYSIWYSWSYSTDYQSGSWFLRGWELYKGYGYSATCATRHSFGSFHVHKQTSPKRIFSFPVGWLMGRSRKRNLTTVGGTQSKEPEGWSFTESPVSSRKYRDI